MKGFKFGYFGTLRLIKEKTKNMIMGIYSKINKLLGTESPEREKSQHDRGSNVGSETQHCSLFSSW